LFAILAARLGEREYFGNSNNKNTVIVLLRCKTAEVSVFGVETTNLVGGSLGGNALHFVSLWSLRVAGFAHCRDLTWQLANDHLTAARSPLPLSAPAGWGGEMDKRGSS